MIGKIVRGLTGGLGLLGLGVMAGGLLFLSIETTESLMIPLILIGLFSLPLVFVFPLWTRKALVAVLLLCLPFQIDQTFFLREHIGGAEGWVVSLSGLVISILYLLRILQSDDGDSTFTIFPRPGFPLLAMMVWAGLSLFVAKDRALGFYEWLELIKMYAIFLYLYDEGKRPDNRSWILFWLLAGLGLECLIAMAQIITGSPLNLRFLGGKTEATLQAIGDTRIFRIGGTLGNSNSLAWYLDFVLPLVMACLLFLKTRWIRLLSLVCFVFGVVVLFFTFSRGGWIGFFLGALWVGVFRLKKAPLLHRIYFGVAVFLLGIIFFTLVFGIENPIRRRFEADDKRSAYVRIPMMRVAWNLIRAHPVLGVGLNNYTLVHAAFDDTPDRVTSHFPYPVHNFFFQTAAEIGLVGLLFFFLFLMGLFSQGMGLAASQDSFGVAVGVGVLGGVIAGMVQALVENGTLGSYHLLPFWTLGGWMSGLSNHRQTGK